MIPAQVCPFKLHGYLMANNSWRFNFVCSIHNHEMCRKLSNHPIACRLKYEEEEIVYDMALNMVEPKNILATLKL